MTWLRRFLSPDPLDLAPRASLVLVLVLRPIGPDWLHGALLILAGAALLGHQHRRPLVWWGLTALLAGRVLTDWTVVENHAFLATWWAVGLATALGDPRPAEALPLVARRLVGLAFACAVVWKLALSADYDDFFAFNALIDKRFDPVSGLLGQGAFVAEQRAVIDRVLEGRVGLSLPISIVRLAAPALVATAWTLLSEVAVAVTMLAGRAPAGWRHAALLVFCATTYLVIPVVGFAWLLLVMGLAMTRAGQGPLRGVYLVAILAAGARGWPVF